MTNLLDLWKYFCRWDYSEMYVSIGVIASQYRLNFAYMRDIS
jgi:hypothetical protein